jgi:hypothetical protein
MEVAETIVNTHGTERCHNPDDQNPESHSRENPVHRVNIFLLKANPSTYWDVLQWH